jgi:hypothetical protein
MARNPAPKVPQTRSLRQRAFNIAKWERKNAELLAQGLPGLTETRPRELTDEEKSRIEGYVPKSNTRKKAATAKEVDNDITAITTSATSNNMAPNGKGTGRKRGDSHLYEKRGSWHPHTVDKANQVLVDADEEKARLAFRFPDDELEAKPTYLTAAAKEILKSLRATNLNSMANAVSGANDILFSNVFNVPQITNAGKTTQRIANTNARRAEANLKKASEISYRASEPLEHTKMVRIKEEHLQADFLGMDAGDIVESLGMCTQDYYLAVLERYKVCTQTTPV